MRNIKLEQNLDGDDHWPHMTMVTVPASAAATGIPQNATQPELEGVIQSWDEIAVLRVSEPADFYFGFIIDDHAQFLNVPIQTQDGKFGVHIGNTDTTFFVFAYDMKTRLTLELVERVDVNDENYQNLPLY